MLTANHSAIRNPTAVPSSPLQCGLALALIGLTALAIDLAAREPGESLLRVMVQTLLFVVVMVVGNRWLQRRRSRWLPTDRPVVLAVSTAFVLPFLLEWGLRYGVGRGWPMEAVALASLRNMLLTCGLLAGTTFFVNLAVGISAFGFLFAFSIALEPEPLLLLFAPYLVTGCGWLMVQYWETFEQAAELQGQPLRRPWLAFTLITLAVLATFALIGVGPARTAQTLAQWMPSSGGDSRFDPFARGGTGDEGKDTVDSPNAKSDGGQGDTYLESHDRTFYDVMNDTVGEPKPREHHNRAISLAAEQVIKSHDHARHHQSGRQFAIYRNLPRRPRQRPEDLTADALVHVTGPTPIHFPIRKYEEFDGFDWIEEKSALEYRMICSGWYRWQHLQLTPSSLLKQPVAPTGTVRHAIKVGQFRSRQLFLPSQTSAFRIGLVDQPDFFTFLQTGIVGLKDTDSLVPAAELIEADSDLWSPVQLPQLHFPHSAHYARPVLRQLPSGWNKTTPTRQILAQLASDWTKDLPRGWPQIAAVLERLRRDYRHDPDLRSSTDSDALVEFLTVTKAGPDYLFATAAALILRQLDYPTRFVAGYYADPQRYDAWARSTPILPADLHFWIELPLPEGRALTLEPTPGYELSPYQPTWSEWLFTALVNALRWLGQHPITSCLSLLCLGIIVWQRRVWIDWLFWLSWRWHNGRDWPTLVATTIQLIERRAWLSGLRRRPGATYRQWVAELLPYAQPDATESLQQLLALSELAWYAPTEQHHKIPITAARSICQRVAHQWHWRRFQHQLPTRQPASTLP